VRLLIAERTENAAHQFDSLLRDAGIPTRLEIIDLPMALDKLSDADMLLCNAGLPELQKLLPRLSAKAPQVPIIVVNNDEAAMTQSEGMELGAADVVSDNESQHLVLVVKRELAHVSQNHALDQTRKALNEAEQRCQLLLQSSRAAIAYVHEGMHIYANEGYLRLFGFEGADDLLGLPLMDLLDSDSSSTLKTCLKNFRKSEEETDFDFSGHSTDGNIIAGNMTLAPAEYEGEECLQVTVRAEVTGATEAAAEAESESALVMEGGVPLLGGDDIIEGAAGTADQQQDAGSFEFQLELVEDGPAAEDGPSVEGRSAVDESPAVVEQPAQEEAEPVATAEVLEFTYQDEPAEAVPSVNAEAEAPSGKPAHGLSDFLAQSEPIAAGHNGQFVSVFVAQVDGYDDMQRSHGLAGTEDACRQVEGRLLAEVDGPFMQISPYQWAILVCDQTRDAAMQTVEAYRASVESMMFEVREKTVRPTCTFGGAILNVNGFDSTGTALEATLNNAFTTLRRIQETSDGNTIELPAFDSAEQEYGDEANRILMLISEAIEKQSFILLFQPIISLRGDSDEHYEVFLRMSDRNGQQLAPSEFLRLAVDNGVAGKIDRWVILQSIKLLSAHRANGHNTRLTINLTSNSVADPEFIQWLGVAIKAARLPSDAVIFQITEQDAATYVRQTREFIDGLKNLHCRSSLSRFGLDSDPMEILSHFPVDFVKLDGTLVEGIDKDSERREEVTKLVNELQNQGKLTIVPMVESASLLSTLWQAGVNYIQGHYLQEPSTSMDYDFSTDD
jgi:PAS domain S-box-containing protein